MLPLKKCAGKLLRLSLLLAPGLSGCVDPFEPAVINAPNTFLVVDGFINLSGVTTIRLSRTQNLSDTAAPLLEGGASVAIEDEAGTRYELREQTAGTYVSAALSLNTARRYRLRLRTGRGREYESDLVAAKRTPPIEQIKYALGPTGVQLLVRTGDPTGQSRYYRWTFEETWEIHTPHASIWEYKDGEVIPRRESIYTCWKSSSSTSIYTGTSEKLSQDVITDYPLALVPTKSSKLRIKYSILVRQYAQTAEEYAYWEKLKKNTESIGTLFDPLPTQLTGNVHARQDAAETVIGYVGAASVDEKRIFIQPGIDLPATRPETGYEACNAIPLDSVLPGNVASTQQLLINRISTPDGKTVLYYTTAPASCADCRLQGTNVRPAFWQ